MGDQIENINNQGIGNVFPHKLNPNDILYDCHTQVSKKKLLNRNDSRWTKISESHYYYQVNINTYLHAEKKKDLFVELYTVNWRIFYQNSSFLNQSQCGWLLGCYQYHKDPKILVPNNIRFQTIERGEKRNHQHPKTFVPDANYPQVLRLIFFQYKHVG